MKSQHGFEKDDSLIVWRKRCPEILFMGLPEDIDNTVSLIN